MKPSCSSDFLIRCFDSCPFIHISSTHTSFQQSIHNPSSMHPCIHPSSMHPCIHAPMHPCIHPSCISEYLLYVSHCGKNILMIVDCLLTTASFTAKYTLLLPMVPQEHNFQLVCFIEKQITRQSLFHLFASLLFMEFL